MQRGYSKSGLAPHLDDLAILTYRTALAWPEGKTIFARDAFQRLVTEQLGKALTNHSSSEHFEAIRIYLGTLLNVLVIKRRPRLLLSLPRYKNARQKVMDFAKLVLQEHREQPPDDARPGPGGRSAGGSGLERRPAARGRPAGRYHRPIFCGDGYGRQHNGFYDLRHPQAPGGLRRHPDRSGRAFRRGRSALAGSAALCNPQSAIRLYAISTCGPAAAISGLTPLANCSKFLANICASFSACTS